MKALVYTAPHKVEVQDVPEPKGRPGAAKVKMHYCGICGSDIGIFAGKHPRATAPLVLGHEFVGTIEEIQGGSGRLAPGDRVVAYPLISCGECLACRTGHPHVCKTLKLIGIDMDGGIADHAWIDEDVLFKVPDSMSDKIAALVEPLAALSSGRYIRPNSIFWIQPLLPCAGPIGVLTAIVLKHSGASRIVISDRSIRLASMSARNSVWKRSMSRTPIWWTISMTAPTAKVSISSLNAPALQARLSK